MYIYLCADEKLFYCFKWSFTLALLQYPMCLFSLMSLFEHQFYLMMDLSLWYGGVIQAVKHLCFKDLASVHRFCETLIEKLWNWRKMFEWKHIKPHASFKGLRWSYYKTYLYQSVHFAYGKDIISKRETLGPILKRKNRKFLYQRQQRLHGDYISYCLTISSWE